MTTGRRTAAFCAVLATWSLGAGSGLQAQDRQACEWPWVGENPASIGVGRLLCVGGACEINMTSDDGRLAHRFATEPRVTELRPPATGPLRELDVIVAIDGVPITTIEGGRRLARLEVDRPVALTIRRDRQLRTVDIVPVRGCPIGSLSVRWAGGEDG